MFTQSKRTVTLVAITTAACLCCLTLALAGHKPNHKPGGGGGGGDDGGGEGISNPAFVYKFWNDNALYLTTSDGAVTARLTNPKGKAGDEAAVWSPDGTQIAFLRHPDVTKIYVDLYTIRPDGSGLTLIRAFDSSSDVPSPSGSHLTWSPDGSTIIYSPGNSLWAINVATGDVQLVLDPPSLDNVVDDPDFSPDFDPDTPGYQGTLAFRAAPETTYQIDIWLLDIEIVNGQVTAGGLTNLTDSAEIQEQPAWSPDGGFLAYTVLLETLEVDIVVVDLTTNLTWTVVETPGNASQPSWSPDGQYLSFSSPREVGNSVTYDIFRVSPWDLSAPVINVTKTDSWRDREFNPRWNPTWVNDIDP